MKKQFKNTIIGAVSVLVKNSNHNSDFIQPRMVDGILTATDKSFKSYVRHCLENSNLNKEILYKKRVDDKNKIYDLEAIIKRYNIKDTLGFYQFFDIKFFGGTLLTKNDKLPNLSTRGSLSINYGINIHENQGYTNHTITSKLASGSDKTASTIGNEHKVNEANYLHRIMFHPNILTKQENSLYFEEDEINAMKWGIYHSVGSSVDGSYKSASKSDTRVGLLVFITMKENDSKYGQPNIQVDNAIKVVDKYNRYDISGLIKIGEKYNEHIEKIEIIYNEDSVEFTHDLPTGDLFKIVKDGNYNPEII